jgi:hypothetical protein
LSIFPLQITPRLIKSLRSFVARSSERDAVNDEARISAVERSIDLVLNELSSGKRGLIGRVKRAVLSPNVSPESEAPAGSRASQFAQAEERIRSLEKQMRMFERIKVLLNKEHSLNSSSSSAAASSASPAPPR